MGSLTSRISCLLGWGVAEETRVMMLGLDSAGKTTMLYRLKLGIVVETVSTIGCNIETVLYKNVTLSVWDVGGLDKIRPLWHCYFDSMKAFIFVVDSSDVERVDEAADELHICSLRWFADTGYRRLGIPLLVLANKKDLSNALDTETLAERLGLRTMQGPWHIQATCATSGEGVLEGLNWLVEELKGTTAVTQPFSETWSLAKR